LRFNCSARNDPRASADNSGTVIKESPSATSNWYRDGECDNLQYRLCGLGRVFPSHKILKIKSFEPLTARLQSNKFGFHSPVQRNAD
jgi:hypothetical protein